MSINKSTVYSTVLHKNSSMSIKKTHKVYNSTQQSFPIILILLILILIIRIIRIIRIRHYDYIITTCIRYQNYFAIWGRW